MKNNYLFIALFVAVLLLAVSAISRAARQVVTQATPPPSNLTSATASPSAVLGVQTKTAGCKVNGTLPDKSCTPGAVFPEVTKDQVCTAGYARQIRNVPASEKDQIYAEYGVTSRQPGQYEVDHLISLELGGSNDAANLWPQPAQPVPGYHQKDQVENYLHQQVCSGRITLQQAQKQISTNWLDVYNQIK